MKNSLYRNYFKYVFDRLVGLIGLIIVSPVLIISAILIKLDSRGPVFFMQERWGLNQEKFKVYKFRTMTDKKRNFGNQVYKDNAEITKVGRILRRYKIDELPQLINVVKGDMSIVGPRPCIPVVTQYYNENTYYRFQVRPGLTSTAGVNGSIYLTWDEKWYYDKEYVENLSFMLDMKIILKTFLVVLFGEEKFLKRPKSEA